MTKRSLAAVVALLVLAGLVVAASANAGVPPAASGRYLVIARSSSDYAAMHADLSRSASPKVVLSMPQINTDVVVGDVDVAALSNNAHVMRVIPDRIETIVPNGQNQDVLAAAKARYAIRGAAPAATDKVTGDPAMTLPGLMWNLRHINAPAAWQKTLGAGDVTVGVADTGLDYTHLELQDQVADVEDFTKTEDPVICDPSDHRLAHQLGAPSDNLDFNGHGSWIGGNIAGDLNGTGINGIAPGVKLVALKISGWCGSAYDSTILNAFIWAGEHGLDVVSISFGGYLDRSDGDQDELYYLYVSAVNYARSLGTTIVASAGNEHTRIGGGGQVLSHGILTAPPGGDDLFGLYEVPGGIPGIVDVSATGNVVKSTSTTCPDDALAAGGFTWCKPRSDKHVPAGMGKRDQLSYYSNYGPRIDVAGPGGARKFNLPVWDRGGTPGWPYTGINSLFGGSSVADGYHAWEAFSTTSNWAQEIPCFTLNDQPEFPDDQCYSIIQGTSMATPHASAVLALIASAHPEMRHDPDALVAQLETTAQKLTGNTTGRLSANDDSPADLTGAPCTYGYCHLNDNNPVSDSEAYGAGLVDAAAAVK
jgi:lantibiotic leader peptide-processing serine protease